MERHQPKPLIYHPADFCCMVSHQRHCFVFQSSHQTWPPLNVLLVANKANIYKRWGTLCLVVISSQLLYFHCFMSVEIYEQKPHSSCLHRTESLSLLFANVDAVERLRVEKQVSRTRLLTRLTLS